MMADKRLRAYFAHSMKDYDTEKENRELQFLRKAFNVICPNRDIGDLYPFSRYFNLVRWADIVVVSEHEGYLTAGVYNEATYAIQNNIEVFLIHPSTTDYTLLGVAKIEKVGTRLNDVKYGSVKTKYSKQGCSLIQSLNE